MQDRERIRSDRGLFERNLRAFASRMPGLHERLAAFRCQGRLVEFDNGDVDIVLGGQAFFGGNQASFIERGLAGYRRNPSRITLTPPAADQGDWLVGEFLAAVDTGVDGRTNKDRTDLAPGGGYFLILLGLGLGTHIERTAELSDCRVLIIVEPEMEFLYHSLSVFDWAALFRRFEAEDRRIYFFDNPNADEAATAIKWTLRRENACALDGSYYLQLYDTTHFGRLLDRLPMEMIGVSLDLGGYPDELVMIRNAKDNLNLGSNRLYATPTNRSLETPVFLVGSGPSLADSLDFIKDNREKAVIVSIGSALKPLIDAGIVPDFQVESENAYGDIDLITAFLDSNPETAGVHLVAAVTCPRDIISRFETTTLYFRAGQTPFFLFEPPNNSILVGSAPSVGNAAISFVQWAGFSSVYMFGVDMGARDPDHHHVAGSYGFFVSEDWDVQLPGNFGGTIMATSGVAQNRSALQEALKAISAGRSYYNCSDGAFIEGAAPTRLDAVDLSASAGGRASALETLSGDATIVEADDFQVRVEKARLIDRISDVIAEIRRHIEQSGDVTSDAAATSLFRFLTDEKGPHTAAKLTVRGTIFNVIIIARYLANRTEPDDRPAFVESLNEAFDRALDRLAENARRDLAEFA